MVCYGMLWYVMVCYGMLWYVMVCYGMLWYVMVCYGMLWKKLGIFHSLSSRKGDELGARGDFTRIEAAKFSGDLSRQQWVSAWFNQKEWRLTLS